ncbi:CBS domain-containing protein [Glycomyces endophyticus]|uniref:CBS domain-containing protein n=1 Tax=Glycomyces endophyticus TaxID=480996 RepID=A0ABP4SH13_9ACTN
MKATDTAGNAARLMAELNIGALPVCGEDDKLKGMVTDRDLVLHVMAAGEDAESYTIDRLPQGHLVLADAGEDVEITIAKMKEHQVNRIPVIDGQRLVGIISLQDVSHRMPESVTGGLVESIRS